MRPAEQLTREWFRADWTALALATLVTVLLVVAVLRARRVWGRTTNMPFLVNALAILAVLGAFAVYLVTFSQVSSRINDSALKTFERRHGLPEEGRRTDEYEVLTLVPPTVAYPRWFVFVGGLASVGIGCVAGGALRRGAPRT